MLGGFVDIVMIQFALNAAVDCLYDAQGDGIDLPFVVGVALQQTHRLY